MTLGVICYSLKRWYEHLHPPTESAGILYCLRDIDCSWITSSIRNEVGKNRSKQHDETPGKTAVPVHWWARIKRHHIEQALCASINTHLQCGYIASTQKTLRTKFPVCLEMISKRFYARVCDIQLLLQQQQPHKRGDSSLERLSPGGMWDVTSHD